MQRKSNHIMVDLEAMDTAHTAAILSIGACKVDLDTGEISDKFYRVVNYDSSSALGLTTSSATKSWWDKQSPEARKVFTDPNIPVIQALGEFATYLRIFGVNSVKLWGNGSDFDNTILTTAYNLAGSPIPWRFYNNRCFRTIRKSLGHMVAEPAREGTYHNALDDAIYQAKILALFGKYIGE